MDSASPRNSPWNGHSLPSASSLYQKATTTDTGIQNCIPPAPPKKPVQYSYKPILPKPTVIHERVGVKNDHRSSSDYPQSDSMSDSAVLPVIVAGSETSLADEPIDQGTPENTNTSKNTTSKEGPVSWGYYNHKSPFSLYSSKVRSDVIMQNPGLATNSTFLCFLFVKTN